MQARRVPAPTGRGPPLRWPSRRRLDTPTSNLDAPSDLPALRRPNAHDAGNLPLPGHINPCRGPAAVFCCAGFATGPACPGCTGAPIQVSVNLESRTSWAAGRAKQRAAQSFPQSRLPPRYKNADHPGSSPKDRKCSRPRTRTELVIRVAGAGHQRSSFRESGSLERTSRLLCGSGRRCERLGATRLPRATVNHGGGNHN